MAQSGFTPIQLYRTTTASAAPSAGNLADGELAINTNDGRLFYKDSGGVVRTIASTASTSGVFAAGTVSAPGITFSGDTNTGIYSPAADTIAFTEGGVEAMRLDASGNVGIGTTAPGSRLDVNGPASVTAFTGSTRLGLMVRGSTGSADFSGIDFTGNSQVVPTARIAVVSGGGGSTLQFGTSNNYTTGITNTAMAIDPSGNVGIGTAAPSHRLEVVTASGDSVGALRSASGGAGLQRLIGSNGTFAAFNALVSTDSGGQQHWYVGGNGTQNTITFQTNGANERMRIDANGNVGIGTTSGGQRLDVSGTSVVGRFNSSNNNNVLAISSFGTIGGYLGANGTNLIFGDASGNERMRLDASGNVGIGTSSPSQRLTVNGASRLDGNVESAVSPFVYSWQGGTSGQVRSGLLLDGSGQTVQFYAGTAERMRIAANGRVGIGTTSPAAELDVAGQIIVGSSSGNGRYFARNTSGANIMDFGIGTGTGSNDSIGLFNPTSTGVIVFGTNSTERVRIDNGGSLRVGTSGNVVQADELLSVNGRVGIKSSLNIPLSIWNTNSNGSYVWFYVAGGTLTGTITTDGSTTGYNTSSDYRLKHDVQPLTGGLATIAALKPSTYKWNVNDGHGEGFIAHELAEHIPLAVSGEKDAVNEDGSIKPQGVDYSKVVVHLVAAVQELTAKVAALESR